jgi:cytoskeleton protein RodZ
MFEIGASLREARNRRGLSLDDVTAGLRLRERYVTALEEERWELLPGEAYTKGFLRMYAEFLGLDGSLYIDEYNTRIAANEAESFVPESLAPTKRRSLLFRTIAGVFGVAALVTALAALGSGKTATAHVQADLSEVAAAATPVKKAAAPIRPHVTAKPPVALIRAVTSRSWLSIRIGGPKGKEVFRGFLNRGHSLSYGLHERVWLRIGRPHALAIRIGKSLVGGLPGTPANLLLTSAGPRAG